MRILRKLRNQNMVLNVESDFMLDLNREESLQQFETETVRSIINPTENFETVRYIHKPYSGITENTTQLLADIWLQFYFYNGSSHTGGLDFSLVGLTPQENSLLMKQFSNGFFQLEFFKVPSGQQPERSNRKLVFSKQLPIAFGEKVFYSVLNEYIHVPVFVGTNYRKSENLYLFWFQDSSALKDTMLDGNTFYMTAKFYNSKDGSIMNFGNKSLATNANVNEITDTYFLVEIDKTDYSYQVFRYNGTKGTRIGESGDPIKFYEIMSI